MPDLWQSPSRPWETCGPETQDWLRGMWEAGDLSYKLDDMQVEVYDDITAKFATCTSSAERWYVLDWGRRVGKDVIMCTRALEAALTASPRSRIAYGAPTADDCAEIVEPIMLMLLEDCPPDLRPTYVATRHRFEWDDGCRIVLVGCDLHPQRLRGTGNIAVCLTEPAFMINLDMPERGVMAAVEATLIDNPDAWRLYGSTPPETPAHPWSTKFVPTAKTRGMYSHRTTYDSPRYSRTQVDGFVNEAGGPKATRARREYFAEHVVEQSMMIVPEWLEERDECIKEVERPIWYDAYVSLDPGWTHLCAGLFGYWDFDNAQLIIEADFAVARANSIEIAGLIQQREKELWEGVSRWNGREEVPQPLRRVSDTDMRLIADLSMLHGLAMTPTAKDNRDAQINALRVHVQQHKVIVNPRCVNLIAHLDHGIWNKQRTKFAESSQDGHFDTIAALVYLDRNIARDRNPYPPKTHGITTRDHMIKPWADTTEASQPAQAFRSAFSGGRRRAAKRQGGNR